MPDNTDEELMVRAAWMYYHHNMTHDQIARRLNTSRVKITRILQKARESGIVEIRLNRPLPINLQLSDQLEKLFGLREAVVVPSKPDFADLLEEIGRATADYLLRVMFPGCRLGFAWSSTLSRMAPYLKPPAKHIPCTISDLAGSMLGQDNPYIVSARVGQVLGVPIQPLLVPAVVKTQATRDAIMSEPSVHVALDLARKSDIAFLGLGDAGPDSTMVRTGYLTPDDLADLRARGAVGDLLVRYFDIHGRHIPHPMDDRIIGLDWEELRQIPHLVNVAAGPRKVQPILGILRSGLCRTLITDTNTAQAVLNAATMSATE
jgi:DNA-binding transcriptional regulator LsrR (DeoR family)